MSVGFVVISRFILHTGDLCLLFFLSVLPEVSFVNTFKKPALFFTGFWKITFSVLAISVTLLTSFAGFASLVPHFPGPLGDSWGDRGGRPSPGGAFAAAIPSPSAALERSPHILPCCIFAFIHFHAFTSSGTSFVTRGWLRRALSVPRCLRISPPPSGYWPLMVTEHAVRFRFLTCTEVCLRRRTCSTLVHTQRRLERMCILLWTGVFRTHRREPVGRRGLFFPRSHWFWSSASSHRWGEGCGSISLFSSITFCLAYFAALLWGEPTLRILVSSWWTDPLIITQSPASFLVIFFALHPHRIISYNYSCFFLINLCTAFPFFPFELPLSLHLP